MTHASDCAQHNEPAKPAGECDCIPMDASLVRAVATAIAAAEGAWYHHPSQYEAAPEVYHAAALAALQAVDQHAKAMREQPCLPL
jgi:hypothetical protein